MLAYTVVYMFFQIVPLFFFLFFFLVGENKALKNVFNFRHLSTQACKHAEKTVYFSSKNTFSRPNNYARSLAQKKPSKIPIPAHGLWLRIWAIFPTANAYSLVVGLIRQEVFGTARMLYR